MKGRSMTAMGQTRSSGCFRSTSAQAPKAELLATQCNVAVVPFPEVVTLFDHFSWRARARWAARRG